MRILFYGYGNPGRQDDGLGILFIEELEKWIKDTGSENIETDSNYQLNIEDAEIISSYDLVIFADASLEPINGFDFTLVKSDDATIEFTMHAVSPAYVLDLCQKIYHKRPRTHLLHIKGFEWELGGEMTVQAKENLTLALNFIKDYLINL